MSISKRILRYSDVSKNEHEHLHENPTAQQVQQKKMGKTDIALLLVVFACVYHLFNLTDWAWKHGVFNTSDLGLLIIVLWFIHLFLQGNRSAVAVNGFSVLIVIYLFFMLMQASIASFNYGQTVINGLIGIRDQFYYLSFFVFLRLLNNERKIYQALNVIAVLAVILSLLALINYFVITIYHHQWAEGHGIRGGIVRAYVAGIDIITLGMFWSALQWIYNKKTRVRYAIGGLLFVFIVILRQTRVRLIGILGVSVVLLLYKKNYKAMFGAITFSILLILLVGVFSEENILLDSFVTSYDDISKGSKVEKMTGWAARLEQLDLQIELFKEHPWIGSGTSAIRLSSDSGVSSSTIRYLLAIRRNEDLGYTNWIKSYGLAGLIWLITFYYFLGKYMKRSAAEHKGRPLEPVVLAASGYLIYVLLTFVTLPHLMRPDLIILFCFVLAILVQTYEIANKAKKTTEDRRIQDIV